MSTWLQRWVTTPSEAMKHIFCCGYKFGWQKGFLNLEGARDYAQQAWSDEWESEEVVVVGASPRSESVSVG